jgi:hypothetical protein
MGMWVSGKTTGPPDLRGVRDPDSQACCDQGSSPHSGLGPPELAPIEIMRRLIGHTSSKLLEKLPALKKRYWGQHFWAHGYF